MYIPDSDSHISVPNMQLEETELGNIQLESNGHRLEAPAVNLSANYDTLRPSLSSPLPVSFLSLGTQEHSIYTNKSKLSYLSRTSTKFTSEGSCF